MSVHDKIKETGTPISQPLSTGNKIFWRLMRPCPRSSYNRKPTTHPKVYQYRGCGSDPHLTPIGMKVFTHAEGVTGETPGVYCAPENRWFPAVSGITADSIHGSRAHAWPVSL